MIKQSKNIHTLEDYNLRFLIVAQVILLHLQPF